MFELQFFIKLFLNFTLLEPISLKNKTMNFQLHIIFMNKVIPRSPNHDMINGSSVNQMASSSGGSIVASVFVTLLIVGAGIYFGLPYLYPNINNPPYVDDDTTYENVVVSVQSQEFRSVCMCYDNELAVKMMNQTTMLITTRGNTSLSVEFSTVFMYGVDLTFDTVSNYDFIAFNITMAIEGVGNYSRIAEFGELKAGQWGSYPFQMHILTPVLTNGTYNLTMYWFSKNDATGSNYLSANHYNNYKENPRLLYVEEIKSP